MLTVRTSCADRVLPRRRRVISLDIDIGDEERREIIGSHVTFLTAQFWVANLEAATGRTMYTTSSIFIGVFQT